MAATYQQALADFDSAYTQFQEYPTNLLYKSTYIGALRGYAARLANSAPKLFTKRETQVGVPFRDWISSPVGFEDEKISDDTSLQRLLGHPRFPSQQNAPASGLKKDPKCRFIFISAGDSRRPLRITQSMLLRILSYHQVMPNYLDFISVFGSQSEPRDLRFSGFFEQSLLSQPPRGPVLDDLGRSGRQYQLCYNLKCVVNKTPGDPLEDQQWSIRQAAFHHQFDIVTGTTLWIVTKGDLEFQRRIEDVTGPSGRSKDRAFGTLKECFISSLEIHLLCSQWSTEGWRWYLQYLEQVIENRTRAAVQSPRNPTQRRKIFEPEDLQIVQHYEDKINEAIMVLEANMEILASLRVFYEDLMNNKDFPIHSHYDEDVHIFVTQLNSIIQDLKLQKSRADVLQKITKDRKDLILQHLQSQATEKMEALTVSNQKEAIAMRIITVVTLIYLPATFVSTFFSTDIIKYQDQSDNNGNMLNGTRPCPGKFSNLALERWLQVTLPLTFVTLSVGWLWYMKEQRKQRLEYLPYAVKAHTS